MIDILLVDDDEKFIDSFQMIDIDNAKLHCFTDPVEALKEISTIKPDIILSDVKMPGIHGIEFCSIVKNLIKPQHFIFISANSKEDIENKHGSIAKHSYFRKPLEDDFYDFIEDLVSKLQKSTSRKATNQPNNDLYSKISNLQPIKNIAIEINDILYDMAITTGFITDDYEKSLAILQRRSKIEMVASILGIDNDDFTNFVDILVEEDQKWDHKIKSYIDQNFPKNNVIEYSEGISVKFPPSSNSYVNVRKLELKCHEESNETKLSLYVNDELYTVPKQFDVKDTNCEKFANIKALTLFKFLRKLCSTSALNYLSVFWHPKIPAGNTATFTMQKPFKVKDAHVTNVTLRDGSYDCRPAHPSLIDTQTFDFVDIPDSCTIKLSTSVRIARAGEFGFKFHVNDQQIETPIRQLAENSLAQFQSCTTPSQLARIVAIKFAWEVASGQRSWQFPDGSTYELVIHDEKLAV